MPYITKERRDALNHGKDVAQTGGELNYCFTMMALGYLKLKGRSYNTMNEIEGAFGNAAKEFYRRVSAPYEDKKIKENGDVY